MFIITKNILLKRQWNFERSSWNGEWFSTKGKEPEQLKTFTVLLTLTVIVKVTLIDIYCSLSKLKDDRMKLIMLLKKLSKSTLWTFQY